MKRFKKINVKWNILIVRFKIKWNIILEEEKKNIQILKISNVIYPK